VALDKAVVAVWTQVLVNLHFPLLKEQSQSVLLFVMCFNMFCFVLQTVILINIGNDGPHLDKNHMKVFLQQLSAETTGVLSEPFESSDG
jgi:uncharacterized protein YhhL (DUF1145 family)